MQTAIYARGGDYIVVLEVSEPQGKLRARRSEPRP